MNTDEIKLLLEKYFEAKTTAEEEGKIFSFFRNSGKLPQDLEKMRPMFEGISSQDKDAPDEKFLTGASAMIDDLNAKSTKSRFIKKTYLITGVAAAIIAGLIYFNLWSDPNDSPNESLYADTYSDPQQGYQAAITAISYVSSKYNQGLGQLNYIPSYREETNSLVKALEVYNRGLNRLEVITNIKLK